VDCEFGGWNAWTDCSATCDGTKRRVRYIKTRAVGKGKACGCTGDDCDKASSEGSNQETAPCNPSKDASGCPVYGIPIDCKLSVWSHWSKCAVTCGVAQKERTRKVEIDAVNGGKACHPTLMQTGSCDLPKCLDAVMKPTDCKWNTWSKWGACDKCGGSMYRFRQVDVHAQFGGKNCTGNDSQDMKTCDRSCFDDVHCAWSSWAHWSECDISCMPPERKGKTFGKRIRKRSLTVTKSKAARLYDDSSSEGAENQVQELYRRAQTADSKRWQEVSAAFALGCLSFVAAFGVLSRCDRPGATTRTMTPLRASNDEEDSSASRPMDRRQVFI